MLCQFERLLYPSDAKAVNAGSYMVAVYKPCESIMDGKGNTLSRIKAVGYGLPLSAQLRYDMKGRWNRDPKFGVQFEVETYDEIVEPTEEGIVAYLCSGQIKGIGPKLARKIYDRFGKASLDILDNDPDKLLSIPGISENRLEKICESYLAGRAARDVVAFLAPYGITANRAVKLFQQYGNKTLETVKEHPYSLYEMAGIGFITADKIARSMGVSELSPERVDAALLYTLEDAECKGNLCLEKHAFIHACLKMLATPGLTEEMAANRAMQMVIDGKLSTYGGFVYRIQTALAEDDLADRVVNRLKDSSIVNVGEIERLLSEEETAAGIELAKEQKNAIRQALSGTVTVVTGGPGTGKTLIQKFMLNIYAKMYPGARICCCAPTGRAARRMEQATGHQAATVHRELSLFAGEGAKYGKPRDLTADFVVVDEVSMLDVFLADKLFTAIKAGAQVVLIGDADQLPSVGPGAVLSELIASGCIPVIRLDKVYRQSSGSRIALNARLIRHGNLNLEYGADFRFIDSADLAESAKLMEEQYLREVKRYGVDRVALLSPFRQKTETCVNALNEVLRDLVNPSSASKDEVDSGKRRFRVGDKVMANKNSGDISNGDIGYIKEIAYDGDDVLVYADFGDGRIREFGKEDLDMLELGYATTVHKSQGSEYDSVIINLQKAHSVMLMRPLVYTAITRGKKNVIIVGERRALCMAIRRPDTEKRGTCLAERLKEKFNAARSK